MPVMILDPNLRAGWEPATPVSDTLLRRFLVNQAGWATAEGSSVGARILQRDDLHSIDTGQASGLANMGFPLAPIYPEGLEETVAVLDEFHQLSNGSASGEVYFFSPWPTPDLRPYGWRLGGHPPLMFRAAGGELPPPPSGLRIEAVRSAEQLREFSAVVVQGFAEPGQNLSDLESSFGPSLLEDERAHLWIGREGERAVSAASAFVDAGINNVTLVATIPDAQRRGYGAALTWRATLAEPTLPAVLFASDAGRPVYERMGYTALFRMTFWWRERGTAADGAESNQ
jgi:GNAT superfamily N-acetyltransferase